MLQKTNFGDADPTLLKRAADQLEILVERGERRAVEAVISDHPDLATIRDCVLELMYLEWVLRCERNETPNVEEYCNRFPDYAEDFEKLVRVDEVVRNSTPESGVTLAERAAINFDPLTVEARENPSIRSAGHHSISVGGYTLERIIGRGGMGVVYQARQHQLDRLVALKTIDFAGSLNPRTVARFRSEAELVARLQHPNIVQVYETGSHSGMPYFSMELVDGGTLATAISGGTVKPGLAARWVEVLARAIHYAHSQGIIHRDLKPANVLLARSDRAEALELSAGSSTASGVSPQIRYEPKIVDFGLAKLLGESSMRTQTGTALGTPSYMAPEQLSSELGEIGPAADVYSLGVILFELLVGRPPFYAATAVETMQQVRNDEPVFPANLRRKLPRDLALICMTCLRKEPAQRYSSAADLANDLNRFLSGNSIQARPSSLMETSLKWAKRHPSAAALMASITVATIGMTLLWLRAEKSGAAEHAERLRAESLVYARNIALAQFEFRSNKVEECEKLLEACPPALRNWEWRYLNALCDDTLWVSPRSRLQSATIDISRDGRYVANGIAEWGVDDHEPIVIWDVSSGQKVIELSGHPGGTYSVSFSRDGKSLASAGVVWKSLKAGEQQGGVKVWNLSDGTVRLTLTDKDSHVVRYSPDGKSIFVGLSSGVVEQYSSQTGEKIASYSSGTEFIADIAFHSNGKLFAACSRDGQVLVWDTETQKCTGFALNQRDPRRLAWEPGSNVLLVSCFGGAIKKFELEDGRLKLLNTQGHNAVPLIAYSPDGQYLATSVFGEATMITEVKTGRTVSILRGHNGHVHDLSFDASGQRLATSGTDGSVRVWDLKQHTEYPIQRFITRFHVVAMDANPSKPEIALANGDNQRRPRPVGPDEPYQLDIFNLETRAQRDINTRHTKWLTCVAYSPDGTRLLTGSLDCTTNCIRRESAKVEYVLEGHRAPISGVAWMDNQQALSIDADGIANIWNIDTGKLSHSWDTQQQSIVALALDSQRRIAFVASDDGTLSLWRIPSTGVPQLAQRFELNRQISALALSPNAMHLAVGDTTGKILLWQTSPMLHQKSCRPQYVLNSHTDRITSLAFSPDSKRLVTGSRDESIKLTDVQTGYELIELDRAKGNQPKVLFSSDGQQVLRAEGEMLWNWEVKSPIESELSDPRKSLASSIAWHRRQYKIASEMDSWFAAAFHCSALIDLEPETPEHLYKRALCNIYRMDIEKAESDLRNALSLQQSFESRVELTRCVLRQGKLEEYRDQCRKLLEESLLALRRSKNYDMAWTCCLSPDSQIDFKAILAMLNATSIVNTPMDSLPEKVPVLESAFSLLAGNSETNAANNKPTADQSTEYNDGIYALCCYRAGKNTLAIKHARIAIKKDVGAQHVHYLTLAMCYARQSNLEAAEKALTNAKKWMDYYSGLNESGSASPQVTAAMTRAKKLRILRTTSIDYPILLAEAEQTLAALRNK